MAGFFLIFFLLPLTFILLLAWSISGKNVFGKTLGVIWLGLFGTIVLLSVTSLFIPDGLLRKDDFYGEYCVDRSYFRGKQANWQYETFRFEIKDNDSIYFYVTQQEKILRIFKGIITTIKPYNSERLVLHMIQPIHHILTTNPTIYRNRTGFYLVFNSPKFGNVFFKKGEWKPLNK